MTAEGLVMLVLPHQIMSNANLTRDQAWSVTNATASAVTRVRD